MRFYAVCPAGADHAGALQVHRVVRLANELAYEASVVHAGAPGRQAERCTAAAPCPVAPGIADGADCVVLLRNEDVLSAFDVALARVVVWWVEVPRFLQDLRALQQRTGAGAELDAEVHSRRFVHLAGDDASRRHLAGRGCLSGDLLVAAEDDTAHRQVFEVLAACEGEHLRASEWGR
ncbi:hypothetical protein [Kineococcus glutinatus]|uniref:Nucleoside 2-deoxyribosyltransferase-like protein n=1 Tax=Kineococcus glutinatus TaxID=1070872 RepID=A0ABP9HAC1_9ACTN